MSPSSAKGKSPISVGNAIGGRGGSGIKLGSTVAEERMLRGSCVKRIRDGNSFRIITSEGEKQTLHLYMSTDCNRKLNEQMNGNCRLKFKARFAL